MLGASYHPSLDCIEEDREADEPRALILVK
jgi:hypothetical protein